MTFQKYRPSKLTESLIAYFWTLRSDSTVESLVNYRLIPDGYVDWIFHLSEPWQYHIPKKEKTKQKYAAHLFGQVKSYMEVMMPKGDLLFFGVKFYPWVARQLWKFDLSEVTDKSIALAELPDRDLIFLEEAIQEATTIPQRISIVEKYVLQKIEYSKLISLAPIIQKIENNPLTFSLSDFSIKKRRIEQRFKSEIGISPKLFQRTIRINKIIKRLILDPEVQLTQLAYEFNFYDQSHFIADFKQFTGCSPSSFLKSINPDGDIYNLKA